MLGSKLMSRPSPDGFPGPNGPSSLCHDKLVCIDLVAELSSSNVSLIESNDVPGVPVRKDVLGVVHADEAKVAPDDVTDVKLSEENDLWTRPSIDRSSTFVFRG